MDEKNVIVTELNDDEKLKAKVSKVLNKAIDTCEALMEHPNSHFSIQASKLILGFGLELKKIEKIIPNEKITVIDDLDNKVNKIIHVKYLRKKTQYRPEETRELANKFDAIDAKYKEEKE